MNTAPTGRSDSDVYYDPYDVEIDRDPYPTYQRLRDEAPIYYNESHDFYAVSRHVDVAKGVADRDTFISNRGNVLEFIKSGIEMPPGLLIYEDGDAHTIHRKLVSKLFTARAIAALEPKIRAFSAACLDPLVGTERFDLIAEFAAQMPMRVIGMLLGIPEQDQEDIRDKSDANLRVKAGSAMKLNKDKFATGGAFAEYVNWRIEHPADDIMTDLLHTEFTDETGVRRTLTPKEVQAYVQVIAGAGNETTTRTIGWTAKVLAEHPDQRRELAQDHSLIPNAIEEILRYESPAPHIGRYVAVDTEFHGRPVPVPGRRRQPRRTPAPRPRPLRHPPADHRADHLRTGCALLSGCGPGPPGGQYRAGGEAEAFSGLGCRPHRGDPEPHLHRPRLGTSPTRPTLRSHRPRR